MQPFYQGRNCVIHFPALVIFKKHVRSQPWRRDQVLNYSHTVVLRPNSSQCKSTCADDPRAADLLPQRQKQSYSRTRLARCRFPLPSMLFRYCVYFTESTSVNFAFLVYSSTLVMLIHNTRRCINPQPLGLLNRFSFQYYVAGLLIQRKG